MNSLFRSLTIVAIALVLVTGALSQVVIDPQLTSALAGSGGSVGVIVTFNGSTAPTDAQISLLNQAGITTGFTFQSLPMAGVLATEAQVNALASMAEVRSIYLNRQLKYSNYDATSLTGVRRVRSDATMTARNHGLPYSGKGIAVLINDSGVDGTHGDLQYGTHLVQNVLGTTNLNAYVTLLPVTYTEGIANTDANSGHGTHVAGIVGGTGAKSNGKYEGVAPGASLIGYGSGAVLFILDGLGGFDYALTHQFQYGIRVITNSWGSSGDFDPEDPISIASKMAYDRGITVLFAAGNEGPGENTLNPYSKAPWVIAVAAGDKSGRLADFSSRGVKDRKGTFAMDGQTWTWEDRPTITAPGVDIISTRTAAPVPALAAEQDAAEIESAYLPFYTTMDGTSMATPHAAGIVALMLEANPSLSPADVKTIFQQTATNMAGREAWEAGAGYINAYAAVDRAYQVRGYGKTVNIFRTFNSNATMSVTRTQFTVDYNPVTLISDNRYNFTVPSGLTELAARVDAAGVMGQTGNTINLILIAPDGTEYSSGVNLLFPLYYERSVAVASPVPGNWTVELRGLRGDAANPTSGAALPEQVNGVLTFKKAGTYTGLSDISGNPAEAAIKIAVSERLVDGYPNGTFKPDNNLSRVELANYLTMGQSIRQFLPIDGSRTFTDVNSADLPFVEAVAAKGAALHDRYLQFRGVMLPTGTGAFSPTQPVRRVNLAYSLVQSLGLESEALARNGQRIPIDDASDIPAGFEGYVQLALDLNLMNAYFFLKQGPYDLVPTIHARFKPLKYVTRGEFAVTATRTFGAAQATAKAGFEDYPTNGKEITSFSLDQNYPNPFNPTTSISYAIPSDVMVTLEVFNVLGQRVQTLVNEVQSSGEHSVSFDASNLPSGVYLYRIAAGSYSDVRRMILSK